MGSRALSVMPCTKLWTGKLVGIFDAKSADWDGFTMVNRMLRRDKEVNIIDVILK